MGLKVDPAAFNCYSTGSHRAVTTHDGGDRLIIRKGGTRFAWRYKGLFRGTVALHKIPGVNINRKIQQLRLAYKSAHDFVMYALDIGQPDAIILNYARRVCPYWDLLHPVMGPAMNPPERADPATPAEEESDEGLTNSV
ncbi:hypothetical protein PGT21_005101 [Puccinia graminis f. sp. tritici]|uniref:Uncharacterized protein n=1 Tax=Puccinia graminis f. sp. tritici TaxID=56615 RepID=A0A5B0PCQ3_PUCGR|nr:hypothetical protein PGT21_005101 [Puccinia graminis f. sp. tritici]